MTSSKRLDIELMRIIAAFFVIFNHTGNTGFFLFSLSDSQSIQYWIYLFISIFCKLSVPLFFMIAGALLLNRQGETLKKLWGHRVAHIVFILVAWSFFYYMVAVCQGTEAFDIKHFISRLYDRTWNFSYWYLYAYIAFLISLPLLQRLAQNLTDKEYTYMFLVYIVFMMIVPSVQYLLFQGKHHLNGSFSLGWLSAQIVIFPLAGYFLSFRKKDFWTGKRILILWAVNILTILLSAYLTYYRAQIMGVCTEGKSQAFHSTFVLINCVAVFVTCQYMNEHSQLIKKFAKPITSLGGCMLGVYLLHINIKSWPILKDGMRQLFIDQMGAPVMLYAFTLCGAVFICGYFITMILKKLPVLRRVVT